MNLADRSCLPQVLKYKKNAPKIWSQAFKPPLGGPFRSSSIVADESEDRTPGPLSTTLWCFSMARQKESQRARMSEAKEPGGNTEVVLPYSGLLADNLQRLLGFLSWP